MIEEGWSGRCDVFGRVVCSTSSENTPAGPHCVKFQLLSVILRWTGMITASHSTTPSSIYENNYTGRKIQSKQLWATLDS